MSVLKHLFLFAVAGCLVTTESKATIVINFAARTVTDQNSVPLVAGTLVQLVNLGPNGVFDSINLGDGDTSQFGQWVSNDDSLITASFKVNGLTSEFDKGYAFDLTPGPDDTAGRISYAMEFNFADLPAGTKLGIRWFPGLLAANFDSITLAAGQSYGQFTRQDTPLYLGTTSWVSPSDGLIVQFDQLFTPDVDGLDSAASARASFTVLVPEPGVLTLAFLGAAGLFSLRRRRL